MIANRKVTGRAVSIPAGIGLGILISVGITFLMSAVLAWMIARETLAESSIGYGVILILLSSTAIGCWICVLKTKRRRMLVSLAVGAGYFIMLLMCTAFFFGGQYQGMGVTALVVGAASVLPGLFCAGERKQHKTGRRKRISG